MAGGGSSELAEVRRSVEEMHVVVYEHGLWLRGVMERLTPIEKRQAELWALKPRPKPKAKPRAKPKGLDRRETKGK